ncbi:unnamed protein product, partial [Brassica oleracea]
ELKGNAQLEPGVQDGRHGYMVDLDNIGKTEFPEAVKLEFVHCILEEGEMMYIPPKWWHYVRSSTMSFLISFWWNRSSD